MKKLFPLLIIITLAFGAVSATSFPAPTGRPPEGNIVPIHTGTNQIKQGSLSVNTFIAEGIALLRQQMYINNTNLGNAQPGQKGHFKGASAPGADNAHIVVFGGAQPATEEGSPDVEAYNSSLLGSDTITAKQYLQSWNVAHGVENIKRELCADGQGQVVFCAENRTQIDVCANIGGIQTSPPTQMVRDGENCVWPTVIVDPNVRVVSGSTCGLEPIFGGTLDDHVVCSISLNEAAITEVLLTINYRYYLSVSGRNSQPYFGTTTITVDAGQSSGLSSPAFISEDYEIHSQCIDMNNVPANLTIPQQWQC